MLLITEKAVVIVKDQTEYDLSELIQLPPTIIILILFILIIIVHIVSKIQQKEYQFDDTEHKISMHPFCSILLFNCDVYPRTLRFLIYVYSMSLQLFMHCYLTARGYSFAVKFLYALVVASIGNYLLGLCLSNLKSIFLIIK